MKRFQNREALIASLALLLTLGAIPKPLAASFRIHPVLAQSVAPDSLPVSTDVPSGTTVKIDGSSSMSATNQELKQRFEQQSPSTEVKVEYQGTDAALQSVLDGQTDLAAVGRTLTAKEKAQDLIVVPQTRRKIAIVVGSENPFTGNLTFEQFAKIFRGEITNWSEVGGPPGAIQLIDRPETSDTRQAFQNYPVFKKAPFKAAASAVKLPQDDSQAMIEKLGTRGIGYAIADQVTSKSGVRIVPMHKTLPTDPRYPFSQPLAYVYKGPDPNPAVRAFLGYAAAPTSPSPAPAAAAAPQTDLVPAPGEARETATAGAPWLWLLLIPLLGGLGGLLWWLLKSRGSEAAIGAFAHTGAVPIAPAGTATAPAGPVTLNGHEPQNLKLYEERLVANKTRQKTGDVAVGKHVETETQKVSVPIEKERVVIERTTPTNAGTAVAPGDADFRDGEVARLDVYQETPDIHKEAFVREEVKIKKVVEQETIEVQETLRREELDIDTEYRTVEDRKNRLPNTRI